MSEEGEGEEGTYFVDQAGHYYFQAKGAAQPVMTVMSALPSQANAEEGEEFIISQDSEENDNVEVVEEVSSGTGILTTKLSQVTGFSSLYRATVEPEMAVATLAIRF